MQTTTSLPSEMPSPELCSHPERPCLHLQTQGEPPVSLRCSEACSLQGAAVGCTVSARPPHPTPGLLGFPYSLELQSSLLCHNAYCLGRFVFKWMMFEVPL